MRVRIGMTAAAPGIGSATALASFLAIPCLLLAAGFAPAKGQAIYVAATLKSIRHRDMIGGPKTTYDMAACERLVVKKADGAGRQWTVVDLMGSEVRLAGTWQPWMFRTKDECHDQIARSGEAPVKKSGEVFTVPTSAPRK